MRYFRMYYHDPFYQTSDVSLKSLCREIFKNTDGCPDGYGKIWETVYFSWGDGELGGEVKIENCRLLTSRAEIKAWDKKERRELKTTKEFWSWVQFYDYLSSVILNYVPTFRYNPHVYTVDIVADFYSFLIPFDPDNFDREVEKLYKLITVAPQGTVIYSDEDENGYTPIEIYLDCGKYAEIKDRRYVFYLPPIENLSQLKEFMRRILKG